MGAKLILKPAEDLVMQVPVTLVTGKLATRTGTCYLTTLRVVVDSEPLAAGAAAAVSILARTVLRKTQLLGSQRQEVALHKLTGLSLGRYGVGQTLDLSLPDGLSLRMVLGKRKIDEFLQKLDEALAAQRLVRQASGENAWKIRAAQ